jgi:hypothetical protein
LGKICICYPPQEREIWAEELATIQHRIEEEEVSEVLLVQEKEVHQKTTLHHAKRRRALEIKIEELMAQSMETQTPPSFINKLNNGGKKTQLIKYKQTPDRIWKIQVDQGHNNSSF